MAQVRYLLLQVRNPNDPMAQHEIECFAQALGCKQSQITICDLLRDAPNTDALDAVDVVLVGGSGDYSATIDADWQDRTFDAFREIHQMQKPMFCSCWGFQAISKAFGGTVVHDLDHAELGTPEIALTEAGRSDPVFGPIGDRFHAPIGHEDSVTKLPDNCTLLGTTDRANQILRFEDAPIYGTQFHPELDREALITRIRVYPKYVEKITNSTFESFVDKCQATPQMSEILRRFVKHVL